MTQTPAETALVAERARELSFDTYLTNLLAPRRVRPVLQALAACEGEIAQVARVVREPMLGEIRLQWWRDAINGAMNAEKSGHPAIDALIASFTSGALNPALMIGMIDARVFDLGGARFDDLHALETYLRKTTGAGLQLATQCLAASTNTALPTQQVETVAARAGVAIGLASVLTTLPRFAAEGCDPLPSDMAPMGLQSATPQLTDTLDTLAAHARQAGTDASRDVARLPRPVRSAFLRLGLVGAYLDAASAPGRDPLREIVTINPARRVWRLAQRRIGVG